MELRLVHRIRLDAAGDTRAPGGAITVALCGTWSHDGDCRWPHQTRVVERGGALVVDLSVTCPPEDEPEVRRLVQAALAGGVLEDPDGRRTTWELVR
ncbi:hypothetical protein [Nocardioides jejuensis]|uniref:Uncharacterized protein n=1 Tax=Nocardioides jejuensis TaxID=2502782 RepID=A0A4R1CC34_9ACTN|nr:hypothetical protein [Nocardioides jejuensis]TCJ28077.1 hypothetical protein EPD65_08820 [Nocardioides jejuensis]